MNADEVRRVLVLGAGTMGRQIALQCALYGLEVSLYDVEARRLGEAADWQAATLRGFVASGWVSRGEAEAAAARIARTADPAAAADRADLVSESVPERVKVKREVFRQFHALCPAETVFTTNSSYYLPSMMAAATGRPERFAAMHFHSPVWVANVVDIAPHPRTASQTVDLLAGFARRIGQVPIVSRKENPGYVFNAMLWAFLIEALRLAGNEVASVEDVDRAWMGTLGTPIGPFGILDRIGLDTAHEIIAQWAVLLGSAQAKKPAAVLEAMLRAGRLGEKSGEGFYRYPGPAWAAPQFLHTRDGSPAIAAPGLSPAPAGGPPPGIAPLARRKAPSAETVCDRLTLRLVPAPLHERVRPEPRFSGAAWILGENALASALRERLERLGARVAMVPTEGTESALAWLDRAWRESPAPHLFLLTARDDDAATRLDPQAWTARYDRGLAMPYFVCQRWFALASDAGRLDDSTLVAATALGGDFAVSDAGRNGLAAEGGGIAGLAKAIFMEGAAQNALGPRVRVVDAPLDADPATLADILCRETALAQAALVTGAGDEVFRRHAEIEVGYVNGRRHVVRAVPAPLDHAVPEIQPAGPWVVTGGARGITAVVALEMGRRYGMPLHLVGTTPLPQTDYLGHTDEQIQSLKTAIMQAAYARREKPNAAWDRVAKGIEIQKTLRQLAQAGVRATYHACDACDRAALARVLDRVRRADGPIAGVIHGAGVEVTGRFQKKRPEVVAATLRVKFLATMALMALTRADPLRYFLVFGSLAGRFGGVGQTDYAMANDALAKQIDWFRSQRPDCVSVAFHWPGWSGVGMSARPESRASLQQAGHRLMPPAEGVSHLLNELAAGGPVGEVLFVDRRELPRGHIVDGHIVDDHKHGGPRRT